MPFQKGNTFGEGRPRGAKNKETLLKEERRAIFEARISQKWEEMIDKLRPEYVADQFMGKAPEKIEHSGEILTGSLTSKEIAEIKQRVKEKQIDG